MTTSQAEGGNGKLSKQLIFCALLALFWVTFLWGFWERGPYALGINATVFFALLFLFFIYRLRICGAYSQRELAWIIPIGIIITGFALYDNPFLKMASVLVLPVLFAVFYNQAFLKNHAALYWDVEFIKTLFFRIFSVLAYVPKSAALCGRALLPAGQTGRSIAVRVAVGVFMLALVLVLVIIPLLSAADAVFSGMMRVVNDWVHDILAMSAVYRVVVFVVLTILFSSAVAAWGRSSEIAREQAPLQPMDSIIAGIVLAGIFVVYVLFLWVQVSHLWVGELPFDFKETEQLVKSGFWQLLGLSVINILIYFFAYRRTTPLVQNLLAVFTVASLLLLLSAGYRMGLYVAYYGFSYEKFFAAYTVLFCALLFVWLMVQLGRHERANIVRFVVMLFLWMFGVVSVFPVEQFIFRANMKLHAREESRIILSEMQMLSPDVLTLVKTLRGKGFLADEGAHSWDEWTYRQEEIIAEKAWYEMTVTDMAYLR